MIGEHPLLSFYVPWSAAVAASSALPPLQPFEVVVDGLPIPLVTCVLGALGVLSARPLVRKKEKALSLTNFILVSAILLVATELWIVQSRPGWLFAFVVSLGVGFTGYSLIEIAGEQVRGFATETLKRMTGASKND